MSIWHSQYQMVFAPNYRHKVLAEEAAKEPFLCFLRLEYITLITQRAKFGWDLNVMVLRLMT